MTIMQSPHHIVPIKKSNISDSPSFVAVGYGLVCLLCIPLFFIGLGTPPLIDPDEPVYAAVGRTMAQSDSFAAWWSPHYNGALWFDKPPLTYWLIGLSMKLFGQSALAARLPSAVCAVVLVGVTVYLAKCLWPRSTFVGVWSGIVLATCLQTVVLARAAVTDMILAALLTAAMLGMWKWLIDDRHIGWLMTAGLLTGLSSLTKGPVAIVLVGGAVLFYLLITRQAVRLLNPFLWMSLVIAIAVALPWYLSMVHEHGSLFVQGFLEANNLTRYLRAEHPTSSSPLWFVPVLLGFIFPWTVPLIFAIWHGFKAARSGDGASLFQLVWIAWVFVFFSASQTKLLTYIYPLYSMASILIGKWIDSEPSKLQRIICSIVFAVVAILIAVILPGYVSRGNGLTDAKAVLEQTGVIFAIAGIAEMAVLSPAFETQRLRRQAVFAVPALCIATFFPLVALAPTWKENIPDLALIQLSRYIEHNSPSGTPTVALGLKRQSLVFYSSRPIIFTDDRALAAKYVQTPPYLFCALKITPKEDVLAELEKYVPASHCKIVLHSGLKYVLIRYEP